MKKQLRSEAIEALLERYSRSAAYYDRYMVWKAAYIRAVAAEFGVTCEGNQN